MKRIFLIALIAFNTVCSMSQINCPANPVGAVFARQGGATPQGTFRLVCGGYEVYTLVCSDKSFQPASLYYGENNADKAKVDAMVPDGRVPTSMNCFVVNTPDGYIMIDTGLPETNGGKTPERLGALGIAPEDIKAIYLTHGHFDHIGGLTDGAGCAAYPSASVYVPAAELAFMRKNMADATLTIESAYSGRLISFEPGEILPGNILPVSAKGHTPGHTAYQLGSLLFVGDLMHGESIQIPDATICAGYDADRSEAIASRVRLLDYAVANSLTVLGAHIPGNGVIF